MVATVQQIIGKINPLLYAENGKELLKKYESSDKIPAEEVKPKNLAEHKLIYDSTSEGLESVYFFTIDLMQEPAAFGLEVEKLVDNFVSTPGSSHFAELGQRATIMQQNATRILGDVNNVMRSILNIIYDLKEFRIRLKAYDDAKSTDRARSEAAFLSLKQIWMDKVDITKGNTSIKAMAFQQSGYQTLIDAFLISKDENDAEKLDLNDRVKRIAKSRIQEFNIWVKQSEDELRKRYDLEKTYLRSQVNSMKLYSRWAKPYLKAAQQLEMSDEKRNPDYVKTFNTILLQLTLLGKSKVDVAGAVLSRNLPADLEERMKRNRPYYSCVLVDFTFRGIPQRTGQQSQYVFGGKSEMTFRAYALNQDELKMLDYELENADINDALGLIEGMTTESIEKFQQDINFFLEEKDEMEEKKKEEKKESDESNPFLALIGAYNKKPQPETPSEKGKEKPKNPPDSWMEKTALRRFAIQKAVDTAFTIFDVYKQAHGMESYTI